MGRAFKLSRRKKHTTTISTTASRTTKSERQRIRNLRRSAKHRRVVYIPATDDAAKENVSPNIYQTDGSQLLQRISTLREDRKKYQNLWRAERSRADGLQRDLNKFIYEEDLAADGDDEEDEDFVIEDSCPEDTRGYAPALSVENMATYSHMMHSKTFSPIFIKAFREFIKIRLCCQVLKNFGAVANLMKCIELWDSVYELKTKTFDLGGISAASMSRVMQYKALQLFRLETIIVLESQWKPDESTFTLHHDEMSYKNEAWLSALVAFDAKEQTLDEIVDPTVFTPKTYSGNIVRGIWHQKIPGKDAETTVQCAIKPAIDNLDELGRYYLGNNWRTIRERLSKRMGCMSDQNTTALLTNKYIAKEFGVGDLVQFVCLMHNLDNALISVEKRLLTERNQQNPRDPVLLTNININIVEIANRLQNHLKVRTDTDKNKGESFDQFFEDSPNVKAFTPFERVIGGRRQHLMRNVEAGLSRRAEIGTFGSTKFHDKFSTTNPRLLYEFGNSQTLLRESLIVVCLSRNLIAPMIKTIGRDSQLMRDVLPKIAESLRNLDKIAKNIRFALRSMLTLSQMYDGMNPHLLTNKLLGEKEKIAIIESTDVLEVHTEEDASTFFRRSQTTFRANDISFLDRYFHYLFSQPVEQFKIILRQYRGVCNVMRVDLQRRYDMQSQSIVPSSVFSTNDNAESLNATGKYHEKRAPNISKQTKAALAIHDVNKEGWETFDYLAKYKPKEFQHALSSWYNFCGTYKHLREETISYQKAHKKVRRIKLRRSLSGATTQIPTSKKVVAKSPLKEVISKNMESLHPVWVQWAGLRDKYLKDNAGVLVSFQKRGLREILRPLMIFHRTHSATAIKTGGLEKLQRMLYEHCQRNIPQVPPLAQQ